MQYLFLKKRFQKYFFPKWYAPPLGGVKFSVSNFQANTSTMYKAQKKTEGAAARLSPPSIILQT